MTGQYPKGKEICDRTRAFAIRIIKLYQAMEKDGVGQVIGKQLLRSGTSVGANVEEAQAAQSKVDFIAKMHIALKETRETHYWLTLLIEAELFSIKQIASLQQETKELTKIIYTIIQKTKTN